MLALEPAKKGSSPRACCLLTFFSSGPITVSIASGKRRAIRRKLILAAVDNQGMSPTSLPWSRAGAVCLLTADMSPVASTYAHRRSSPDLSQDVAGSLYKTSHQRHNPSSNVGGRSCRIDRFSSALAWTKSDERSRLAEDCAISPGGSHTMSVRTNQALA